MVEPVVFKNETYIVTDQTPTLNVLEDVVPNILTVVPDVKFAGDPVYGILIAYPIC